MPLTLEQIKENCQKARQLMQRSRDEHFAEFWNDYSCLDELKAHYQRGGLGDVKVKKFLNNVIVQLFYFYKS